MKKYLLAILAVASLALLQGSGRQRDFSPGQTVPESYISEYGVGQFFRNVPIPDTVFASMQGRSFKKNCTVPRDSLRYILCLHRDIKGNAIVGEMVVNKAIAKDVLEILRELYEHSYPIERMRLVDNWNAEDEALMRDNNSSSFNFRFISHTTKVSKHGMGMAVDINPLYNPYVKTLKDGRKVIEPATAGKYTDRKADFPYKIKRGDLCYRLFIEHGFTWGGDWKSCKDWQHFEK